MTSFYKILNFADRIPEGLIKYSIVLAFLVSAASAFAHIQALSYAAPFFFIFIIFAGVKNLKADKNLRILVISISLFAAWAFITASWSVYPYYSMTRAVYFLIVSTGAVFSSYLWVKRIKKAGLSFLLPVNLIVVLTSLISLLFNYPADAWTGGNATGFMGFTVHQNTLGAIILFTIPSVIACTFQNSIIHHPDNTEPNWWNIRPDSKLLWLYILLVFNIVILSLSWSRSSILSAAVSCILYFIFTYRAKAVIIISLIILCLSFLLISNPGVMGNVKDVVYKKNSGLWNSRFSLYKSSFMAAQHSGLAGLGYGISDTSLTKHSVGVIDNSGRFIREKGNGFLACIEETGIIGALLFSFILYAAYQCLPFLKLSKISYTGQYGFIPALLFFFSLGFLLHSNFEAWIMSTRSIELPIYFAFSGVFTAYADRN